jgi:predicted lipoprotein
VNGFNEQAVALNTLIDAYLLDPKEDQFLEIKNRWKLTTLAYEKAYAFNIGKIRSQFLHEAIYLWPIATNSIEDIILNTPQIDEDFINSLSPSVKSIAALEYLLFKSGTSETNAEFILSENRRNYLKYAAKNLMQQSERIQNIWGASGENYADEFINNNEDGIQGSFNRYFNGLYNLIDTGKVSKIGKPGGLENSSVINASLSQAYRSDLSLSILRENMEILEQAYFNPAGIGVDDYVLFIRKNEDLNLLIQEKISDVKIAIEAFPVPFFDAITSHYSLVENLHGALEELLVLFATDLRSTLSIVITSTDNDGD